MPTPHIRAGRMVGVAAVAALSVFGPAATSAHAADPVSYSCRASAVTAQVAGGAVDDPVRAGNDTGACAEAVSGAPQAAESLSLDKLATARTAYAAVNPNGAKPVSAHPQAVAGIEGLDLAVPGTLSVGAARSTLSASCTNGQPVFTGRSEVANITLGGQPIVVDGVLQPLTDALSQALGALVSVKLNEQVDLPGGGKAVRAAHIELLALDGSSAPLADVIVAESRLTPNGNPCDPSAPPNNDDTGDDTGDDSGTDTSGICPPGSVLDVSRKVCVIAVPGSQTSANPAGDLAGKGSVVVGKPYEGPKGGRVVALSVARKRYASPCTKGKGPKYAVVGTKGANHITGTNQADRILGLGGNDRLDGGRGNDCIDGMKGSDTMTGGQGDDRVYGHAGNDHVNGDSGNDRLVAGTGNDSINAGYGKDRAYGGPGRDAINIATAGPKQWAIGGKGFDTIRANPNDKVGSAEKVYRVRRVR